MLYKELKIEYDMQERVSMEVLDCMIESLVLENLKDTKIVNKQEENSGGESSAKALLSK